MLKYLLLPLCVFILQGCEQKQPQTPESSKVGMQQLKPFPEVTSKPVILFKDPIDTVLVETAVEAIPTWRKYAAAKPTLILLSQNPFLSPIPEQVKEDALLLTHNGSLNDFRTKATPYTVNPVILPNMAVSTALEAGFFSQIIWILPTAEEETALSLEIFRKQLIESGNATRDEADTFIHDGTGFAGTLRQIPISVVPYHALERLAGPAMLHFDLSFLQALYINEIKTPIHSLSYQLLSKLRETETSTFATTLSHSHREGNISLEVRFLGSLIKNLLANPDTLDQPLPEGETKRKQVLYLGNFFQKEKILEQYLEMEKSAPQDASVKFALYHTLRQFRLGDKAFVSLAQAVELDSAYALEYLNLSPVALQSGETTEALRMLKLASQHETANPFIQIQVADIQAMNGEYDTAISSLEKLLQLPWSDLYFKGMTKSLESHIDLLKNQKATASSSPEQSKTSTK